MRQSRVRLIGTKTALLAAVVLGLSTCGVDEPDSGPMAVQRSAIQEGYDAAVSPLGAVYRPDGAYADVGLWDIYYMVDSSNAYFKANPGRLSAVSWAMTEQAEGRCGDTASEYYGAYYCFTTLLWPFSTCTHDEWCSEFALWVLHTAGLDPNGTLRGTNLFGFVTTSTVRDRFDANGLLWGRDVLTRVHDGSGARYPQPGDYLFERDLTDGTHWGHSGIVIGISNDSRYVYTVEGNTHGGCVTFYARDYIVNGVLSDRIDGVGRIQPWAATKGTRTGLNLPHHTLLHGAPDPVCAYGILSTDTGACCASSCGTCGGDGCSGRVAEAEGCCIGHILSANISCSTWGPGYADAGCVAPDPNCTRGILSDSGACCPASCGTCGGNGCSSRPGGAAACCTGHIINENISCADQSAPCMVQ